MYLGGACEDLDRKAVLQYKAKQIRKELEHIIQTNRNNFMTKNLNFFLYSK